MGESKLSLPTSTPFQRLSGCPSLCRRDLNSSLLSPAPAPMAVASLFQKGRRLPADCEILGWLFCEYGTLSHLGTRQGHREGPRPGGDHASY